VSFATPTVAMRQIASVSSTT